MAEEPNLESILAGCREHIPACQKMLYKYCFANMMRICLRYNKHTEDAAGCYNEAMMKVFSKIHQYTGEGAFLGWVRTIVVNTCITQVRAKTKFSVKPIEEIREEKFTVNTFEGDITAKEILELVRKLPASHSIVFNMHIMEGYSHDEIGKMLEISAGTSKWYLHEARNILKQQIQHLYYNDANSKII
jgi:RNA polymerase sigma-70 factor, ECF subfamily